MVDGTMASAAYWIGSAVGPGNIYSSSPANMIGSIGVRAAILDRTDQQKQSGVKKYDFVSKNAPNKLQDPKTDAGKVAIQAELDAIERVFHSRVAAGRGVSADYVAEKFGQGGCYVAQDPDSSKPCALSVGMVDHITAAVPLPKSVPDYLRRTLAEASPAPAAAHPTQIPAVAGKEKSMSLDDFLKENPDAAAAINTRIAAARAEGVAEARKNAEKIGAILSSDAYKANGIIQTKGLEALSGKISVEAFETIVSTVDAITEAGKIAAAAAAAPADTPAAPAASPADLVAKAAALKLDVAAIKAAAVAAKMDPDKALAAEVSMAEMVAADKARQ
jgi:hypothetical protein